MDLDGLGARCSLPTCATLDYLPLKCAHCTNLFCSSHHAHAAHTCPSAPAAVHIPSCPICSRPVPASPGLTLDDAMSRHIDAGCARRERRNALCGKPGCETRDITRNTCPSCAAVFCLTHRLEADHACAGGVAVADSPLTAAMRRLGAPAAQSEQREGRKKKSIRALVPRRDKSRSRSGSPRGGRGAAKTSSMVFSNTREKPLRAAGMDSVSADDVLNLAVYFAPAVERRPEFWQVSRRWSAGKVLDALKLPDLGGDRFGFYVVRHSGAAVRGITLVPRISALRDGDNAVRNGDAVVVETGENGVPPGWADILSGDPTLQKFCAAHAQDRGTAASANSSCSVS